MILVPETRVQPLGGWYVGPTVPPEGALPVEVVRNIKRRMASAGLTQAAVAKAGHIDDGLLSALLRRTKAANLRALEKIAAGLSADDDHVTMLDLFQPSGPAPLTFSGLRRDMSHAFEQWMAALDTLDKRQRRATPERPLRFRLFYINDDVAAALQAHPQFRGQVAAGTPMPIPADWPDDFYNRPEYMEFSE